MVTRSWIFLLSLSCPILAMVWQWKRNKLLDILCKQLLITHMLSCCDMIRVHWYNHSNHIKITLNLGNKKMKINVSSWAIFSAQPLKIDQWNLAWRHRNPIECVYLGMSRHTLNSLPHIIKFNATFEHTVMPLLSCTYSYHICIYQLFNIWPSQVITSIFIRRFYVVITIKGNL